MKKSLNNFYLGHANSGKIDELDRLSAEYMRTVQMFVDHIHGSKLKEARKFDKIPVVESLLSERWLRCAWQQATGMMQSWFSNERTNKPELKNVCIFANANVVKLEQSENSFEYWLKISTLNAGHPIYVPLNLYKRARREISRYPKLCSSVRLNKVDGQWFASLVIEKSGKKNKANGTVIGVDIGMVNLIAMSTGDRFGQVSEQLAARVKAETEKGSRVRKLNSCLKKKDLPEVRIRGRANKWARNEIGRAINQFVAVVPANTTVVLERLSVKDMHFKSRTMNRRLRAHQLGYLADRIRFKLDDAGIRYGSVQAAYSSQECCACGFVSRDNRKSQSCFHCVACGHTENADDNASKVIAKRLGDSELNGLSFKDMKPLLELRFRQRLPDGRSPSAGLGGAADLSEHPTSRVNAC